MVKMTEVLCNRCGYPIWLARASQSFLDKLKSKGTMVTLDPFEDAPGRGDLSAGADGRIVIDDIAGTLVKHGCPSRSFSCKYCGDRVIKLLAPPGIPERMMILNAEPRDGGTVVLGRDGRGLYDPDFKLDGTRYHWHTKHERTPRP